MKFVCIDEPHWRSTVVPHTETGQPAVSATLRPMFQACSSTCVTQPHWRSSICAGSTSFRATSPFTTWAESSSPRMCESVPFFLPIGLRTASTISASCLLPWTLWRMTVCAPENQVDAAKERQDRADRRRAALRRLLEARAASEVAGVADEVVVPAGYDLTHEGAAGREFVVIVEGAADVRRRGRKVNALGSGDFLGEIALISRGAAHRDRADDAADARARDHSVRLPRRCCGARRRSSGRSCRRSPSGFRLNSASRLVGAALVDFVMAATATERKLLIDGEWIETGEWIEVRSPYSGDVVGRVAKGGAAEARRAVDAAARALESPLPAHKRAEILVKVAGLIGRRHEEVARTISDEAGKPIKTARVEASRAMSTYTFAAVEARKLAGEMIPMDARAGRRGQARLHAAQADRRRRRDLAVQLPVQPRRAQARARARRRLPRRAEAGVGRRRSRRCSSRSSSSRPGCRPAG